MKRLNIITISFFMSLLISSAQNETDALRYSQVFPGGTARMMSMGGAFSAFGGDFSTLSINPAGIGVYRSSEYTVTPSMNYMNIQSQYLGNSKNDSKSNFFIGNAGLIFSRRTGKSTGLVTLNFGVGYNRENDFHQKMNMGAVNNNNSLLDNFADNADGTGYQDLYPFEEGLAWDVYMIDTVIGQPTNYETVFSLWGDRPNSTYGQEQRRSISSFGGIGEYVFSMGANINNMFYFGGTFGIHNLNYTRETFHYETDPDNHIEEFDYFKFYEYLRARGTGFSFKMGFLYKPIQMLRIGGAVHFPYSFRVREDYYSNIEAGFDTPDANGDKVYTSSSPNGSYDYRVSPPFKVIGNVGVQLFKLALIGMDIEFINYTSMSLHRGNDGYDFMIENEAINEAYRPVVNVRGGAEFKLGAVSLRGGAAYYMSPYKESEANKDASYLSLTCGLGYRTNHFFIDMAYVYMGHDEYYFMYPGADPVKNTYNQHQFLTTIGFKF